MSPRMVVTDHAFANTKHEQAAAAQTGAEFAEFSVDTEDATIHAVHDADVAFVNFAPMTARVLSSMKPGSTVIRYGIGFDNVDLEAAKAAGVRVANVPDYGVETVADHASTALLTLARRIAFFHREIHSHGWVKPTGLGPILSMRQHTLGLLGFGRIAQAVHNRLRPFGVTTIAYDPFAPASVFHELGVEQVDLDELAQRTTALSVHAPLTPETDSVVSKDFIAQMPEGAFVVNTARGGLIDEGALAEAVDSGHLSGALLDVTRPEPAPEDSPLRSVDNVLLTPHAAFYDEESLDNLQRLASEEAIRAVEGAELRCQVA
jgi:D-3-phosphoglycerate dehydrogenase